MYFIASFVIKDKFLNVSRSGPPSDRPSWGKICLFFHWSLTFELIDRNMENAQSPNVNRSFRKSSTSVQDLLSNPADKQTHKHTNQ